MSARNSIVLLLVLVLGFAAIWQLQIAIDAQRVFWTSTYTAGAVESAVCVLSIDQGRIPPTINLTDPDPRCALDYVPLEARERRVTHALNNSFGFGGTNCSLVFSRFES